MACDQDSGTAATGRPLSRWMGRDTFHRRGTGPRTTLQELVAEVAKRERVEG